MTGNNLRWRSSPAQCRLIRRIVGEIWEICFFIRGHALCRSQCCRTLGGRLHVYSSRRPTSPGRRPTTPTMGSIEDQYFSKASVQISIFKPLRWRFSLEFPLQLLETRGNFWFLRKGKIPWMTPLSEAINRYYSCFSKDHAILPGEVIAPHPQSKLNAPQDLTLWVNTT